MKPEILLRVGSDRRNLSYVSQQPLPWAEVQKGDISLTLTEYSARVLDGLAAAEAQQPDKRIGRANQALLKQQLDDKLLEALGDKATELLAGGITLLEGRMNERNAAQQLAAAADLLPNRIGLVIGGRPGSDRSMLRIGHYHMLKALFSKSSR